MKKYFTNNGTNQEGPFDIEDLKTKGVNRDTQIWYEGLPSWTVANNIEELRSLFVKSPPPLSTHTPPPLATEASTAIPADKKINWKKLGMWSVGIIVGLILTIATQGLALLVILIILGVYFVWKKIGGLKIFSIISIVISIVGLIAGFVLIVQGIQAKELGSPVGDIESLLGIGLIIFSIYFLAYSITVLASVRKNKLGYYETK